MADKLVIAIVNANPDNALQISIPLMQAMVAASMEYETEVIFSGRAGKLAIADFAAQVIDPENKKSLLDIIHEAYEAGVVFKVCTPAMERWGETLIPQIQEIVGGTYLISEAMDDDTIVFTY